MKYLILFLLISVNAFAAAGSYTPPSPNANGITAVANGGFGTSNASLSGGNNNFLQLDPTYVPANTTIKIVGPLHLYADAASLTYALTTTASAPTGASALVISSPGTYMVSATVSTSFSGATLAAVQAATCYLYRTNNTAATITDTTGSVLTPILTTTTLTGPTIQMGMVSYSTSNSTDSLSVYCSMSVVPSAGSMQVTGTHISAVRVF